MPQATDELRDFARSEFGSIDLSGPQRLLESRGFKLTDDWRWERPAPDYYITQLEFKCLDFLIQEWDYGGLVPNGSQQDAAK